LRRRILLMLGLVGALVVPVRAGTFSPAPVAPDLGLDALTKRVAREQLGKQLFGDPWATVTLSHVDLYDRFPYIESRHFLIVSDPAWNRLVYGEVGKSMHAFDGAGTATGTLAAPRGMAVDDQDRVYVADAGHGRVLVLQARSEFGDMSLTPVYAIDGLSDPHGVAWSDAGTPFQSNDDVLFVTDTGRNRVAAYALADHSARLMSTLGELGSGDGHFAGPMAIVAGRDAGASTSAVYVADSHTRRIVRLTFAQGALHWQGSAPSLADAITSLATDEWGNVYAAAPQQGTVRKFNAALEPLAELRDGVVSPRAMTVPFFTVHDHRDGRVVRAGQPTALVLEPWGETSGLRRWDLGVSVEGLAVSGTDAPQASFTLTDHAAVTLDLREVATGRVVSHRDVGVFDAGHVSVPLMAQDLSSAPKSADLELVVSAKPGYEGGVATSAHVQFRANGGGVLPPTVASLMPAWPNPAGPGTRLRFALPAASAGSAALSLMDASGRRVRTFAGPFVPGVNDVAWDGRDDRGRAVRSGLYFYCLDVAGARLSRHLVVVR
jgi:flagellar hook capping protein FlgD/NHL repeat-containing protein